MAAQDVCPGICVNVYRCDWQGNFSTKHLGASWNIFVLIKAKLGSNDTSLFIDNFLSFLELLQVYKTRLGQ